MRFYDQGRSNLICCYYERKFSKNYLIGTVFTFFALVRRIFLLVAKRLGRTSLGMGPFVLDFTFFVLVGMSFVTLMGPIFSDFAFFCRSIACSGGEELLDLDRDGALRFGLCFFYLIGSSGELGETGEPREVGD